MIIAQGLKKAGSADPVKLRDAIIGMKGFVGMQGIYNFSPTDHHGTSVEGMILLTVKDGKWEAPK